MIAPDRLASQDDSLKTPDRPALEQARARIDEPIRGLLTRGNPKTEKGRAAGYLTHILHLAPFMASGYQTCPMATKGCAGACLNRAGRGGIIPKGEETNPIQVKRVLRTLWFFERRDEFMARLVREIENGIRYAERKGLTPVFRLNGTSDIRWETVPVERDGETFPHVFAAFPDVQFYDYTKLPNRRVQDIPNYHLTFSLADGNEEAARIAYGNGMNVAAVFRRDLPTAFDLGDGPVPVFDADADDLRFLDPRGIAGLRAKGPAKKDTTGFVQDGSCVRTLPMAS